MFLLGFGFCSVSIRFAAVVAKLGKSFPILKSFPSLYATFLAPKYFDERDWSLGLGSVFSRSPWEF